MKKIFIASHAMELGGAETSLLGLLESIDKTKYSVDLFLYRHNGELLKFIPPEINLLPEIPQYTVLARPIKDTLREGHFSLSVARFYGKLKAKKFNKKNHLKESGVALEYSHKFTKKFMPPICPDTEYDLAISFLTPHYFVAEKVNAKKKIAWIHTDYSVVKVDVASELKMWTKYDKIISISDNVTDTFSSVFPSLKSKVTIIENIISKNYVNSLIDEFSVESEMLFDGSIKLLTIGRFSPPKKLDDVPQICSLIRQSGINIKWYLIGFGGDEQLIRNKITEYGMQDYVIILGKKSNPYPYINACDIYAQPSRYEGKSIAVREAQMLNKPVVITDFPTANSQLKNGVDGVIVPLETTACAKAMCDFIKNTDLQNKLIENTKKTDYTNSNEINKLYELVI